MGVQKVQPESHVAKQYKQQSQDSSLSSEQREAYALLAKAEAALEQEEEAEAREAAEQALELCRGSGYEELAADASRYTVKALIGSGQLEEAKRVAERDLEDFRNSGSQRGEASMLLCLACLVTDSAEALKYAVSSGTLFHRLGDKRLECAALVAMCEAQIQKDDGDQKKQGHTAFATATMARDLAREAGDLRAEAEALHAMALAQERLDCFEEAMRYADEAMDLYLELKDKRREAGELLSMADLSLCLGDFKQALIHAEDAMSIYQELGSKSEVEAIQTVYRVLVCRGDFQAARKIANRGLKRFHDLGNIKAQSQMMFMLINLNCKEGEIEYLTDKSRNKYKDALEVTQKALRLMHQLGEKQIEARLLVVLSALCLRLDRLDGALLAGQQALKMIKETGDTPWTSSARYFIENNSGLSSSNMGDVLFTLSHAYMKKDQHEEALALAQDLQQYFRENSNRRGEAAALMTINTCYLKLDMKPEAMKVAMQAQMLFNEAGDAAGEAYVLRALMDAEWDREDYAAAVRLGERAAALFREVEDRRSEAGVLYGIAVNNIHMAVRMGARVGDGGAGQRYYGERTRAITEALAKAQRAAENGVRLCKELMQETTKAGQLLAASLATLAQVHMFNSKPATALECADEAVILFREQGDYHSEGSALLQSADALRVTGQYEEAKEAAEEALSLCQKYEDEAGVMVAKDLLEFLTVSQDQQDGNDNASDVDEEELPEDNLDDPVEQPDEDEETEPRVARVGRPLSTWGRQPSNVKTFREHRKDPEPGKGVGSFDPAKVRQRILALASDVLNMDGELAFDTPLMEVGMTSNAAIVFRDTLQEEIPSVNLPVTLVFDYPSIASMMRMILQQRRSAPKPAKR